VELGDGERACSPSTSPLFAFLLTNVIQLPFSETSHAVTHSLVNSSSLYCSGGSFQT
jgi:hypothetical protein